eukprot:4924413-Pleurochrysis_carterae.AAC.3
MQSLAARHLLGRDLSGPSQVRGGSLPRRLCVPTTPPTLPRTAHATITLHRERNARQGAAWRG